MCEGVQQRACRVETRRRTSRQGLALLAALVIPLSACALFVGGEGRSAQILTYETEDERQAATGAIRFMFDDFGGLSTETLSSRAIPWKVAVAALLLDNAASSGTAVRMADLDPLLARFGFIVPTAVENAPPTKRELRFDRPIGLLRGYIDRAFPSFRLEVANLGCAACHAGRTYDASGRPRSTVWLGSPNTSIDLEAYSQAIYRSLKKAMLDPAKLYAAVNQLYPEADPRELDTIREYVLPAIAARLQKRVVGIDAPLPYSNGGSGMTNGVAALKQQLGVLLSQPAAREVGFTSIPDLGSRVLRSSLLYDGLYSPPAEQPLRALAVSDITPAHAKKLAHIVAFFTVPALGVEPEKAEEVLPRLAAVMNFLATYRPPPFPGTLDRILSETGRRIYATRCSECHGRYQQRDGQEELVEFPNRFVPQDDMRSDPERWQAIDAELLRAIRASAMGKYAVPHRAAGYVAPPLSGLWATAPYLHNGSVPTLWHLMHPDRRPTKFLVGGHRLDFARVGIDGSTDAEAVMTYPVDYVPWCAPSLYDTTRPGLSNTGHESEFRSMSETEKRALLEYLKLL